MKLNTLFFAALMGISTFASSALADAGHSHGACNVPGHYMAGMVGEIDVQL